MAGKELAIAFFLIAIAGTASADYSLCDSTEYESASSSFTCHITESKLDFLQQDIDAFWEQLMADSAYKNGQIGTVTWKVKNATVQVADDLHFLQPAGLDLAWDIVMQADGNNVIPVDLNLGPTRPQTYAAMKKSLRARKEFLISFAPLGERRSVRSITMQNLAGGNTVYIEGSVLKPMEIDLEEDLIVSGGYMQNINELKAKAVSLDDKAYLENVKRIEAESMALDNESFIRRLGAFDAMAVTLSGSLSLDEKSYISNLVGSLEAGEDITIVNESRIETLQAIKSDLIEGISARNISLTGESFIKGLGGKGKVVLSEGLTLDNSSIIGVEDNKPSQISANSVSMENNSLVKNFSGSIDVTGNQAFSMQSGSQIDRFAGSINSCAPLSMDGNATKIRFTAESQRTIKAVSLEMTNGATIGCYGDENCDYTLIERVCGALPTAYLDANTPSTGYVPLTVEFVGNCDGQGEPVTCVISFGDGSTTQTFTGLTRHTYVTPGTFNAVLAATNSQGQSATSKKTVIARQQDQPLPTEALQVSASKQSVKPGEQISLNVNCAMEFQSIAVENDLGLPPLTHVPEECPLTLGPFTIPEDASPGTHIFTVMGVATDGSRTVKTATFEVEEETSGGFLPFDLDLGDMAFTIFVIELVMIMVLLAAILIIIAKKRKGKPGWKEYEKKLPKKQKAPEEMSVEQRREKLMEEEPAPEEPEPKKPEPATGEGEKPPWLRSEEEEFAEPEPKRPEAEAVEEPEPKPPEPAAKARPEPPEAGPVARKQAPPIIEERVLEPKPMGEEEAEIAKELEPEEQEPADRFKQLVEELKQSRKYQEEAKAMEKPEPAPPVARPAAQKPKPAVPRAMQAAPKPAPRPSETVPKKKPVLGIFRRKPAKEETPVEQTEPTAKPAAPKPEAAAPMPKPAAPAPKPAAPAPKPAAPSPKPKPPETQPMAAEPKPAAPSPAAPAAEKKPKLGFLKRKKKPEEKKEEPAPEQELPPWLKRE